jgi:3-deoxy-D-manno-octulosonate 8-phosphate phosphatase (KDO 8-P phosphatase)
MANSRRLTLPPLAFVLDVDGVLTTGQFLYGPDGKAYKIFGPDDSDGLALLKDKLDIAFVSADHRGFPISKSRIVDDMHYPLDLVSQADRASWISDRWDPERVIYMGDGIFDHYVFATVGYSICPANGFHRTQERADYVTISRSAERAVAEACLHIMEIFFEPLETT